MNTPWNNISINAGRTLKELPGNGKTEYDILEDYANLWGSVPRPEQNLTPERYVDEVLMECEPGSSLFIFGAGPSMHSNIFKQRLNFERIVVSDLVEQSSWGLDPSIEFRIFDILQDDLEDFDYIFSSHTIEHFNRADLMNTILPKCLRHAKKAVIFITPYSNIGWDDPYSTHRVELTEHDELAAQALKWKRIRDNVTAVPPQHGIELVLWFEGQA